MNLSVIVVQHGDKQRRPGDPGLSALGRAQAARTADWLGATELPAPTAVCSSPLRRARQTAAPIAARLGLKVALDDRLRERMNWAGPEAGSLEDFLADWARASHERTYVPQSGDSSARAGARFLEALTDLATTQAGTTVIAVAHGGVTVDLLRTIAGDGPLLAEHPLLIDDGVPSGALTRLRLDGDHWSVESVASTAHLVTASGHRPA